MTASRALRNAPDVSPDSVARVKDAAKAIGYVGNFLASSLSGRQSELVGVVVPSISNIVFADVLAGIAEGIAGSGLQTVFGVTDYDMEKEYDIIRKMMSWSPAGLIVTGLDQSPDTRRLLEAADAPVVQIMDVDGAPVDACVGFSHVTTGAAMADALIKAGRRRFGYVGCDLARDTRAAKRLKGFKDALSKAGLHLAAEFIEDGPSATRLGRDLCARILAAHPDLDCLYFSNDDLASGAAFHCIAADIDVPGQLTLAGFNGLDLVESLPVRVVTSRTPRRIIGKAAIEHIAQRGNSPSRVTSFTPEIIGLE